MDVCLQRLSACRGSSILRCPHTYLLAALIAGLHFFPLLPEGRFASLWDAMIAHSREKFDRGLELLGLGTIVASYLDSEKLFFTLSTVLLLEVVFWSLNTFLFVCYKFDLFKSYKLRGAELPPRDIIEECLKDVVVGHLFVRPPLLYLGYSVFFGLGGMTFDGNDLPPFITFVWQFFFCMMVDDTIFYWVHRGLHHKSIYKNIHKKHHRFQYTVGVATEYSHPIEDLSNTLSTVMGPSLLFLLNESKRSSVLMLWTYILAKLWQSIEAHSGYNPPFPISPFSVLKSMDCSPAHDFHHSHNTGNYGGWFVFWDWICGTDIKYTEFLKDKKAEGASAYWNVLAPDDNAKSERKKDY